MKSTMLSIVALCVLAGASLAFNPTHAHGNHNAEHGGLVRVSGETSFELVTRDNGVELYVKNDEGDLSSAGMTAKLTIVNGSGEKQEIVLTPAGANKFAAQGVQITSGSRVAVQLTLADKESKIGANFIVK